MAPDVGIEEIHDHRYSFISHILRGTILNEIYHCEMSGNGMVLEEVSCKEGDEANVVGEVSASLVNSAVMKAGSHYFMRADTFHRSQPLEKSVTCLDRNDVVKERARVIRQKSEARVCPFSNKMEESKLWEIIEDCINDRAGYHLSDIEKGVLGHPSKIVEEARELLDAHEQQSRIMAAVELSDLYGAMKSYMAAHLPDLQFDDLEKMSSITERAFRNGRR